MHLQPHHTFVQRRQFHRFFLPVKCQTGERRCSTETNLQGRPCGPFTVRSQGGNLGYESVQRVTFGIGVQPPSHCSTSPASTHPHYLSSSGVARAPHAMNVCKELAHGVAVDTVRHAAHQRGRCPTRSAPFTDDRLRPTLLGHTLDVHRRSASPRTAAIRSRLIIVCCARCCLPALPERGDL
jgi:hypothetical protein